MKKSTIKYGSVCSGIEAAHFAFHPLGYSQVWSSEIADFPSKVLSHYYPNVPNVGSMLDIPQMLINKEIEAPDILCGGTPCQAFSFAGWKEGLKDDRGQLTLTYIDIANSIDRIRKENGKPPAVLLWENVEGVLNDKSNAFGMFLSGLAGLEEVIKVKKWTKAGYISGKDRNIAWRILDAKYFGLPQQRKRLFVIATGKDKDPSQILFELGPFDMKQKLKDQKKKLKVSTNLFSSIQEVVREENELKFEKEGIQFEMYREYTDCVYTAYATKWNGNAAAYNGSLYVCQDNRLRRLTPLECERLMGFPDDFTEIPGHTDTNRYHAIGNSWAVPVVQWLAQKLNKLFAHKDLGENEHLKKLAKISIANNSYLQLLEESTQLSENEYLNCSASSFNQVKGSIKTVVQTTPIREKFYLSAKACHGIIRRKREGNKKMNPSLEQTMIDTYSKTMKESQHVTLDMT